MNLTLKRIVRIAMMAALGAVVIAVMQSSHLIVRLQKS